MSAVVLSLLVLSVLPIVLSWVSGTCRHQQFDAVDNKNPREQNQQLEGAGARAVAAQKNAWEALLVLVAAVAALTVAAVDLSALTNYFYALIALRVLHALCYVINQDIIRSLSFLGAYGICIYFFILAI
ncbi:MAG: MAPEG family protein [Pseudomonadales bacterium]|nr:MAPEG family protein [Pseudomonadales bacterium]